MTEPALNVFAEGVEWGILLVVILGLLFGGLNLLRRALGIGRDV